MKKILLFAAAIMMAATASAQKVSSTTYLKEKSQTQWYGRIGMSINNMAGAPELEGFCMGSKIGMDVDFGFQKNIGRSGLYWGMELGIGTRGATDKFEDEEGTVKGNISAWNVKYSPFTFGYKYSLTDDLKLDGHFGLFASYDFTSKYKVEDTEMDLDDLDYIELDAGIQVGIGVWWKKFNLDFTYQRGFVPAAKLYTETYNEYGYTIGSDEYKLHSSNFMIRLGYAF